ncbi:MAG TPA: hypothetical protein DCP20_03655 [Coriobacteriia bacterium]|nr:MAG: hypothetical protein XD74_0552 [Actinobacteria bacterium 66_15]HAL29798.1 hypothetical protein [Coriobacteriia bacterium]
MHTSVRVLAAGLVAGVVVAGGAAFANAPEAVRASTQATYAEQRQPQASVVASATPEMVRERAEEHGTHASRELMLSVPGEKHVVRSTHRIEMDHASADAHASEVHHNEHPAQAGTDHADQHGSEAGEQCYDGMAAHDSSVTVHASASVERNQVHESGTAFRDSTHHSGDHR